MAAIIEFGQWNVTLQDAKQNWIISLTSNETVSRVVAEFFRGSDLADSRETFLLIDEGAVNVDNYTGPVRLRVRVYDGAEQLIGDAESTIQVHNADVLPPTAPEFLQYQAQSPTAITFLWGISSDNRGVAGYNVYNIANGVRARIARTAHPVTSTTVSIDTRLLSQIVVTSVDAYGNESVDSPSVHIFQDRIGPKIVFGDWAKSGIEAQISWEIYDQAFITEVRYTIQAGDKVVGPHYDNPIGFARIGIADYEGPVTISVTARNSTGEESTATSTVMVYTRAPLPPTLGYEDLSHSTVRIILNPPATGPTIEGYVLIYSRGIINLGKNTRETVPVSPGTRETFYARTYTPDGTMSELSLPLALDIPRDPTLPPPKNERVETTVLQTIESMMTPDVRAFLLQLFTDTRMRNPVATQSMQTPPGLKTLIDYFALVSESFGAIIRRERTDEESYLASELVDKLKDPLHKLATWAERMEYDFVFNLGG